MDAIIVGRELGHQVLCVTAVFVVDGKRGQINEGRHGRAAIIAPSSHFVIVIVGEGYIGAYCQAIVDFCVYVGAEIEGLLVSTKHLNYLDVRLKHQFSQVTAYITVDESVPDLVGTRIYSVVGAAIAPTFQNATLKASDATLVYGAEVSNGTSLNFGAIPSEGTASLQSQTVSVISDGSPAMLNIGSMIINQVTNGLSLSDFPALGGGRVPFRLEPGVRYTLRLEIAAPCTQVVTGSGGLHIFNGNSGSFTFTESDFGAEIDIFSLDNSFNMLINGKPLYIGSYAMDSTGPVLMETNEIQFQGFNSFPHDTYFPNIEFEDGSRWGLGGVLEIYDMVGTSDKPSLRIVVNDNGIAMYGSKRPEGDLYPLKLINEETVTTGAGSRFVRGRFNPDVRWYSDQNNTITVSQIAQGRTYLEGNVRGKKIVPCSQLQP